LKVMTGPGDLLSEARRTAMGLAGAYAEMGAAVASDVAGIAARRPRKDPFEFRDPAYIERTLPAWRAMSNLYFRADVRGLGHIPAEGPVLLVGNHSGGIMIVDTFIFAQAFHDHFGAQRPFYQLAHDLIFKTPGARELVQRGGTVPASPQNMARALERDAALLVYPGGDDETFRPSWESGTVDFADRTGFIKLALEHKVPIVPVVSIGGQETGLFLGRGRGPARALGLNRMRLNVLPAVLGPPFGLTVLDFPGRLPLPAKISIRVLKPIDLHERLGKDPDVDEGYKLVTSTMQRMLTRLSNERTLPVVG
jgi:1-acyl-sn-glycerol-3-phosphate acyltransferase